MTYNITKLCEFFISGEMYETILRSRQKHNEIKNEKTIWSHLELHKEHVGNFENTDQRLLSYFQRNEFSANFKLNLNGIESVQKSAHIHLKKISMRKERAMLNHDIRRLRRKVIELRIQLEDITFDQKETMRMYKAIHNQYSKAFQFELNVLSQDGNYCKFQIDFIIDQKNPKLSVFLCLNVKTKELIDLDSCTFCTKLEESEFLDWYRKSDHNLPGLMCKLRNQLKIYLKQNR